ncbi:MAG: GNAT family N-acetyltransferase [Rickettsiales bacterium]
MAVNPNRFFSRFPALSLGDIKLRDLMLGDKERYFEMMSDPEVTKFLSDEDVPTSVSQAEEEIKFWGGLFYRKQSVFWAVAETSSDQFIGTVGYNTWNYSNKRAEISYDLMRAYWRKGIMTRALNNALIFGFKEMDLLRIEARTMVDNIPSQKILEKVGFKREGLQRNYRVIRGEPIDVVLYGLTPSDFKLILS